jgi:acetyl-CoA carboxylase biotin carboxyl carrier protein
MRPADVKRLMDAMAAAGVIELELEQRDEGGLVERVRLVCGGTRAAPAPPFAAEPASHGPSEQGPLATPGSAPPETKVVTRLVDVVAPIVGIFYASPAPESGPYVKVGDRVQVGSVLCIIEAMKLMNEIEAEVAGTVAEVLVKNEDPVEYGQVLFRIDPS